MLIAHIEGAVSCPFCDLSDITVDEMILHVNSAHLDYLSPNSYEDLTRDDTSGLNGSDGACGSSVDGRGNNLNRNYALLSKLDSPQRSKLSLNLKYQSNCNGLVSENDRCDILNDVVINCPICGHTETSPNRLQEHVNRQHFDLTSPSFPALSPLESLNSFNCPLCVRQFQAGSDLELHVNIEHKDILSPAKATKVALGDENSNQSCPVCNLVGFANALEMASHIEDHFERKPTLASPEIVSGKSKH